MDNSWIQHFLEALVPLARAHDGEDHASMNMGSATPQSPKHSVTGFSPEQEFVLNAPIPDWVKNHLLSPALDLKDKVTDNANQFLGKSFQGQTQPLQDAMRYPVTRPLTQLAQGYINPLKNLLTGTNTEEPFTTWKVPHGSVPEGIQKELGGTYAQSMNMLTPMARFSVKDVPKKDIIAFGEGDNLEDQDARIHNEGQSNGLYVREALLRKAVENSGGLNTKEFFTDLEKLQQTNPWVYDHVVHHYMGGDPSLKMSSKDRALELFGHLGAMFGPDILNTPLAPHYKGIMGPPPENTRNYEDISPPDDFQPANPSYWPGINPPHPPVQYPLGLEPGQFEPSVVDSNREKSIQRQNMIILRNLFPELRRKGPTDPGVPDPFRR